MNAAQIKKARRQARLAIERRKSTGREVASLRDEQQRLKREAAERRGAKA